MICDLNPRVSECSIIRMRLECLGIRVFIEYFSISVCEDSSFNYVLMFAYFQITIIIIVASYNIMLIILLILI